MAAKVFVATIPPRINDAAPYYRMFPIEPAKNVWITLRGDITTTAETIYDLLTGITQAGTGQVLIVSHAVVYPVVSGLKIPLTKNTPTTYLDGPNIDLLAPGKRDKGRDKELASSLKMAPAELGALQEVAARVRKLTLERVLIRGCEIGKDIALLTRLKSVFNCTRICAPTLPLFYGNVAPRIAKDDAEWFEWLNKYPDSAFIDEGYAWHMVPEPQLGVRVEQMARARKYFDAFIRNHLPQGRHKGTDKFYWEGMRGERPLIFPNDRPTYRDLLASA